MTVNELRVMELCNNTYKMLKVIFKNIIVNYDVGFSKNGDLPRISDGFSQISIGSKGLRT